MQSLALHGGPPVRTRPWPVWPVHGEREIELLTEVVRSGIWSSGPKEEEFAERFADFQDARYGVCVSSGSRALEVALQAAGVGPGDEVIMPTLTFVGTAEGILSANAVPVLVDVDPHTYCIDPAAAAAAITDRTKAIVPVHICSCIPDMDAICELADRTGLVVVEDAARAHGSRWKERGAGTIGLLGAFSLQSSKAVNCGEGGIILTNNRCLADICRAYRNNGRPQLGSVLTEPLLGRNYRLSEFQAAVGLAQLERADEQITRREKNGLYLSARLAEIEGIDPLKRDDRVTRQNYYKYVFRFDAKTYGLPKERFVEAMEAEGIPVRGRPDTPLQMDPLFVTDPSTCPWACPQYGKCMVYRVIETPVAYRAQQEAVSFEQNLLLGTKEDMDDIVLAIRKIREHISSS